MSFASQGNVLPMLVSAIQVLVIIVVAGLRFLLYAEFLAENVFVCLVFV